MPFAKHCLITAIISALALAACDNRPQPPLKDDHRIQGLIWFGVPIKKRHFAERFFLLDLEMDFKDRGEGFSQFALPSGQDFVLVSPDMAGEWSEDRELYEEYILGFRVADVVVSRSVYEARGVRFARETRVAGDDGKWAYFRDPQGFLMEIFEPPSESAEVSRRENKQLLVRAIRSVVLAPEGADKTDEAREFFTETLGLRSDSGGDPRKVFVSGGDDVPDVTLELRGEDRGHFPTNFIIGFVIENDIEEARDILAHRGVEILPHGEENGAFYIRGPEGLIFRIERIS